MAGCSEVLMLLEKHKHTVGSELNCSNILPVLVKKGVFSSKEDELLSHEYGERNSNLLPFENILYRRYTSILILNKVSVYNIIVQLSPIIIIILVIITLSIKNQFYIAL